MKTRFHIILLCLAGFTFNIGCEKTDLQKTTFKEEVSVTTRTEDCDDCIGLDCCCFIQWLEGDNGLGLQFCGIFGPRISTETCEADPPGSCSFIDGYLFGPVVLNSSPSIQFFCMDGANSFAIYVTGTGTANYNITCPVGQTGPQTININLTGGNRYYFSTDGECVVVQC